MTTDRLQFVRPGAESPILANTARNASTNGNSARELTNCISNGNAQFSRVVVNDASASATAETMKRLALRTDVKRRRLFLMERAERFEICAGPFQWKIGADDFDDVIRGRDLLNGFRWDHVVLFFARLLFEAMPNLLSAEALPNNEEIVDPGVGRPLVDSGN